MAGSKHPGSPTQREQKGAAEMGILNVLMTGTLPDGQQVSIHEDPIAVFHCLQISNTMLGDKIGIDNKSGQEKFKKMLTDKFDSDAPMLIQNFNSLLATPAIIAIVTANEAAAAKKKETAQNTRTTTQLPSTPMMKDTTGRATPETLERVRAALQAQNGGDRTKPGSDAAPHSKHSHPSTGNPFTAGTAGKKDPTNTNPFSPA